MKTLLFMFAGLLLMTAAASAQSTVAADSLKAYLGTYTFSSGSPISTFTVTADKGQLYGEAESYGRYTLLKQPGVDTYKSTSSYGSIVTFVRDAATKAVTSLTLAAQGNEMVAKKDKP